ncbi:hypothetical protein K9M79_08115 [Candidatus Woesearchaeota archaeon]|nr:hypothetical protein [Candidatus Woesearchaeota archaeon]
MKTVIRILLVLFIFSGIDMAHAKDKVDILMDKLIEKGIITNTEAQALKADMESSNNKNEQKQQTATVAASEKKSNLTDDVKIGGTYFLEYYYRNTDSGNNVNGIAIKRAYLNVSKTWVPWFSTKLTTDITYDSDRNKEIGWEFRLKNLYGQFYFKNLWDTGIDFKSQVGLVPTASDKYDGNLWPYRPQGSHFLDRHKIFPTADFGGNIQIYYGGADNDLLKLSKKYAEKCGIEAGVYNGSGYNHSEVNNNKIVEILAFIRPFWSLDQLKGLRVAVQLVRGQSESEINGMYPEFDINQLMISYQHEYFTLLGQYYYGTSGPRFADQYDRDGWNVGFYVRAPFHKKLRAFFRYDVYNIHYDYVKMGEYTMIYGLSYNLLKGVMPWTGIEQKFYDEGDDSLTYQAGLAIKF